MILKLDIFLNLLDYRMNKRAFFLFSVASVASEHIFMILDIITRIIKTKTNVKNKKGGVQGYTFASDIVRPTRLKIANEYMGRRYI